MMQEFWVFGYGSLMWNPGFEHIARTDAVMHGLHRSLCIYSHVYRGTPEVPGLVMGLDRGGACRGAAFQVAEENWTATVDYLRAREQVTSVYLERSRPVRLLDGQDRMVDALVYIVDRNHEQYAGRLTVDEQLAIVRQGHGKAGPCADYVSSTVRHLQDVGIHDAMLEALHNRLA